MSVSNIIRGERYLEPFTFKDANGNPMVLKRMSFSLVVRSDTFIREYTLGAGLEVQGPSLVWYMYENETAEYDFDYAYYTLYYVSQGTKTQLSEGSIKIV